MMILFDSIYASYWGIIHTYVDLYQHSILIRLGDFYSNVPNQNNKRGEQKLSSEINQRINQILEVRNLMKI